MKLKFKKIFQTTFFMFLVIHTSIAVAQLSQKPTTFSINTIQELRQLFKQLRKNTYPAIILIEPGVYNVTGNRLTIPRSHITLLGSTGDPKDVIFDGGGMQDGVGFIFDVSHSHITISGVTLKNVKNHLIQVRAEKGASDFSLTNCVMQNAYQQLLKVSGNNKQPNSPFSERGKVSNCVFEYTEGIGPQFYIGGIDAHRSKDWVISNNIFRNIASPEKRVAEHAVHFWRKSANNIVKNNIIINCDRGIGFGLGRTDVGHTGGIITENFIFNEGKKEHIAADAGIILENANGTVVSENHIYFMHNYPNAIEYRYVESKNIQITNNSTNRRISARDGGSANLENNTEELAVLPTLKYMLEKLER